MSRHPTPAELDRIRALHEAGHGVVGYLVGQFPRAASLDPDPDDGSAARVYFDEADLSPTILAAGHAAERRAWFPRTPPKRWVDDPDTIALRRLVPAGADPDTWIAMVEQHAYDLLTDHWWAVVEIAAALQERRRLAPDELRAAFDRGEAVRLRELLGLDAAATKGEAVLAASAHQTRTGERVRLELLTTRQPTTASGRVEGCLRGWPPPQCVDKYGRDFGCGEADCAVNPLPRLTLWT